MIVWIKAVWATFRGTALGKQFTPILMVIIVLAGFRNYFEHRQVVATLKANHGIALGNLTTDRDKWKDFYNAEALKLTEAKEWIARNTKEDEVINETILPDGTIKRHITKTTTTNVTTTKLVASEDKERTAPSAFRVGGVKPPRMDWSSLWIGPAVSLPAAGSARAGVDVGLAYRRVRLDGIIYNDGGFAAAGTWRVFRF